MTDPQVLTATLTSGDSKPNSMMVALVNVYKCGGGTHDTACVQCTVAHGACAVHSGTRRAVVRVAPTPPPCSTVFTRRPQLEGVLSADGDKLCCLVQTQDGDSLVKSGDEVPCHRAPVSTPCP